MNARLYDPSIGRHTSADSIIPESYGSQSFNRYSYVINNPLKYIDPTGHNFCYNKNSHRHETGLAFKDLGVYFVRYYYPITQHPDVYGPPTYKYPSDSLYGPHNGHTWPYSIDCRERSVNSSSGAYRSAKGNNVNINYSQEVSITSPSYSSGNNLVHDMLDNHLMSLEKESFSNFNINLVYNNNFNKTIYPKVREKVTPYKIMNDTYGWNKIVYSARNEISKASAPLSLVKRWGAPLWVLSSSLDITKYRESKDGRDLVNTIIGNPRFGFWGSTASVTYTFYGEI
jgi:hypothetical protein